MERAKDIIKESLSENKGLLTLSLVLAVITQVFSLLDPILFQQIIDNYALQADQYTTTEFVRGVGLLVLGIIGVAFVSRVAKTFKDYYVNVVTERLGTHLYATSVDYTLTLPYQVFEDRTSGEVLQKIQKAREDVQTLIQDAVDNLFLPLIGAVFVIGYAFYVHPYIGAAFTVLIPLIGWLVYTISQAIKDAQRDIVAERGELSGSTTETLRNIELVKSLGLERQEITRLNDVNEDILGLELKKVRILRKLSFIQGTAVNAARSGILFLMVYLIFTGNITVGQLMTLFFYSFLVFGPLQSVGSVAGEYQQARASIELLEDVYSIEPKPVPTNPVDIGPIKSIALRDLSFSYEGAKEPAVKDLSLRIPSGTTTAFVGPSGAGKSTVVKLLLGLYEPDSGDVLYNDVDIHKTDMQALRKRIGFVTQNTQLFATSIRENLQFVNPSATDKELHDVLRAAQVDHIVTRADTGLSTKIGEGGIKLSGGERQRLAIARALLRNPEVIIFDEATSNLDSQTEREITRTTQRISEENPDLIVIVIAHRLSTVTHAGTIYTLRKGEIAEHGTHSELLEKQGLYSSLWELQSAQG